MKISRALSIGLFSVLGASCSHKEPVVAPEAAPQVVAPAPVEKGKCFAIGRAAFDKACYKFKTKTQCLETSVRHNCGWEAQ